MVGSSDGFCFPFKETVVEGAGYTAIRKRSCNQPPRVSGFSQKPDFPIIWIISMEILAFIFSSFWHFIGFLLLFGVACRFVLGLFAMLITAMTGKKVEVPKVDFE